MTSWNGGPVAGKRCYRRATVEPMHTPQRPHPVSQGWGRCGYVSWISEVVGGNRAAGGTAVDVLRIEIPAPRVGGSDRDGLPPS